MPALLTGLLAAVLFGAATPASKSLLETLTPFQLAGLLYLGAALGVLPVLVRERSLPLPWSLDRRTRRLLLGATTFGGILGPVFLLFGLRLASSASVALWLNLELVATVLLGLFFFRDHLTPRSWLAAGGTLAAAVVLSAAEGAAGVQAGLLVFLACLCWGLDNHWTALIDGITPSQATFWKGVVAGATNLTIGIAVVPFVASVSTIALALTVGVFCYGASIVLYIMSAHQIGATRGQIVFSTSPFFGVLLSVVLLGEGLSGPQILATAVIVLSLVVLFTEKHEHLHAHEAIAHRHWHRHDDGHHDHVHEDGFAGRHSHWHEHEPRVHAHAHWPDLHHRHLHDAKGNKRG